MDIQTTKTEQSANEVLGTPAKSLYYLIIKNKKGTKLVVNVGQKTHDEVQKLRSEEEQFIQTTSELKKQHENEKK